MKDSSCKEAEVSCKDMTSSSSSPDETAVDSPQPQHHEDDALSRLSDYLSHQAVPIDYPRQRCTGCHGSRTIYCSDCLEILLPRESWPESILKQRLCLPFSLDILLDDRKASSTGVQAAIILKAAGQSDHFRLYDISEETNDDHNHVPNYNYNDDDDNDNDDGTFLLFPDVTSVPLSSVLATHKTIKRIIVLDCKWTKLSKSLALPLHKSLANVPRIRLDDISTTTTTTTTTTTSVPSDTCTSPSSSSSFYWRWHNAGDGAVSTIEAIYYAACQIQDATAATTTCLVQHNDDAAAAADDDLLDLFWLFRIQRNIIAHRYQDETFSKSRAVPFSDEGKEFQRALRQKHKQNNNDSATATT